MVSYNLSNLKCDIVYIGWHCYTCIVFTNQELVGACLRCMDVTAAYKGLKKSLVEKMLNSMKDTFRKRKHAELC